MYEVELKAIIKDKQKILDNLHSLGYHQSENVIYEDVYFDSDGTFKQSEQELRIRKKQYSARTETVLTYKEAPFDKKTKSKPEYEVILSDFEEAIAIFLKLGYEIVVRFEKRCTIFLIPYKDIMLELALVQITGLDQYFIEIESLVSEPTKTASTLSLLYEFLANLEIQKNQLTAEYYTDIVKRLD